MANIGFNGDDAYDPGVMGGGVTYTDPTTKSPSPSDPFSTVTGYYQSLLGRAPESADAVNSWIGGTGGDLNAIYSGIYASPEAAAFRGQATTPPIARNDPAGGGTGTQGGSTAPRQSTGPSGDPQAWLMAQLSAGGDPQSLINQMNAAGGPYAALAAAYYPTKGQGVIGLAGGSYLAKNADGSWGWNVGDSAGGSGGGGSATTTTTTGGNPGGYTDQSSQIYLDQVLQRLSQVQQPQDNSIFDLLKSLATQQATKLQQAPYTPADDAALITQYRQPLTQARDTAKQAAALDLSRRGIGPTSGVYQDRMKAIDTAYEGGVAQGANQMGVNAVAQKNTNAMQALQILSSLSTANNTQIDRSNAMSDEAVTLAKMFPDFDTQRLNSLLQASGDTSSSSALSSLLSLGNLNAGVINTNNLNDQANAAAWGKLFAALAGAV